MPQKLIAKDIPEAVQVAHIAGTDIPVPILRVTVQKRRALRIHRISVVLKLQDAVPADLPVDAVVTVCALKPGLTMPVELARLDYAQFSGLEVSDQKSALYSGQLLLEPHPTPSGKDPELVADDQLIVALKSSVAAVWANSTLQFYVEEVVLQAVA